MIDTEAPITVLRKYLQSLLARPKMEAKVVSPSILNSCKTNLYENRRQ